ncbi:MAG TPA: cyclic nucleotide-binding domain-containing protein [Cytophagaceae bacterium]
MIKILKKALKVEGDEIPFLLWMLLFGFFLGISITLFDLAAVANFLDTYDPTYLPGAIICSGLLGIFATNTYISIQNWVSYTKISLLTLIVLVVITLSTYIAFAGGVGSWIIYVGFVVAGPITTLGFLLFWSLFDRFFDVAQSKRVSTVAETGLVLASVGVLIIIALADSKSYFANTGYFLIWASYSLIFCLFTLIIVSYQYPDLKKVVINVQYIKAYNNYKKLIRQPYILILALFSLFSAITFFIVDYTYLKFANMQYADMHSRLSFLAGFAAGMIGLSFALQMIGKWINEKYGYLVTLMVLPVLVALFAAIYGVLGTVEGYDKDHSTFFFLFMLVCISKLLSYSLYRSVEFSTFRFFFMPLDQLLRGDVQSKIERVVREAGKVVAGLIIIAVIYYAGFEYLPYFLLGIIAIWSFITFKMNKAYREKLKVTLDSERELEKKDKASEGITGELKKIIPGADSKSVIIHLNILKILDPIVYKEVLLVLLENYDEDIQKIALLEASALSLLPAIPVLERIQVSKYYPILRNRDLVDKVHAQLKAAEFRLEKVKYIEQLTLSKLRQERVFGALLAAYAEDSMKPRLLNKLFRDNDPKVRYMAVASSANTSNIDLQKNLIEKLGDSSYGNAAVSAVTQTGEKMFPALENAFYLTGQDEKIQLRIVQAYGRLCTDQAVHLLLKKLTYRNQNVSKAAFQALSRSGFNITGERVLELKAELEEYCSVLVWNMSAFLDLEYAGTSTVLLSAVKSEIDSNYDSIFKILSLLYDPKTVSLIKENIFSEDPEKSEYAIELLEVLLADEIKVFLLPLLNTSSYEDKVWKMQEHFPSEPLPKLDVLYDLIQRDYKYVNRWTKACAIRELTDEKGEVNLDIFLANVINPDPLLSETAAVALYIKAPELFKTTFERFKRELGAGFSKDLIGKIVIDATTDHFSAPSLKLEMIKFMNEVEDFRYIPGIVLMEVARVMEFQALRQGESLIKTDSPDNLDYYVVRSGKLEMLKDGQHIAVYEQKQFIHNYQLLTDYDSSVEIRAVTDTELYKIRQEEFNELMSFYEEIPWSMIKVARSRYVNNKLGKQEKEVYA